MYVECRFLAMSPQPFVALSGDRHPHPMLAVPAGYNSAALIIILICIYPLH
jgi:hypothetical protein